MDLKAITQNLNSRGFTVIPLEPSLAMLDEGWNICGTELSDMQPDSSKINLALESYQSLLSASKITMELAYEKEPQTLRQTPTSGNTRRKTSLKRLHDHDRRKAAVEGAEGRK